MKCCSQRRVWKDASGLKGNPCHYIKDNIFSSLCLLYFCLCMIFCTFLLMVLGNNKEKIKLFYLLCFSSILNLMRKNSDNLQITYVSFEILGTDLKQWIKNMANNTWKHCHYIFSHTFQYSAKFCCWVGGTTHHLAVKFHTQRAASFSCFR